MKKSHTKGFTLAELMLALLVAAIVIGMAIPNMQDFARNGRLAGAANELLRSLQLARNEAVKRQLGGVQSVIVCASANPTAATPSCGHGAQEFTGWFVFQDANGDWQFDAGDVLLEQHELLDSTLNVRSDGDNVVSYVLTGFVNPNPPGLAPTQNILICDSRGVQAVGATDSTARAVLVDRTGRSRVTRTKTIIDGVIALDASLACP